MIGIHIVDRQKLFFVSCDYLYMALIPALSPDLFTLMASAPNIKYQLLNILIEASIPISGSLVVIFTPSTDKSRRSGTTQ